MSFEDEFQSGEEYKHFDFPQYNSQNHYNHSLEEQISSYNHPAIGSLQSQHSNVSEPQEQEDFNQQKPKKGRPAIRQQRKLQAGQDSSLQFQRPLLNSGQWNESVQNNSLQNHWADDTISQELIAVIMENGKYQYAVITGKKAEQRNSKMGENIKELLSQKKTEFQKKIEYVMKFLNYPEAKKGSEKEYFFIKSKKSSGLIKQLEDGQIVSSQLNSEIDPQNYDNEYERLVKILNSVFKLCENHFADNLTMLLNTFVREKKNHSSLQKIKSEWLKQVCEDKKLYREFFDCQFVREAIRKERQELDQIENDPNNYQAQKQTRATKKELEKQKEPKRNQHLGKDKELIELNNSILQENTIIKEILEKFAEIFEKAIVRNENL